MIWARARAIAITAVGVAAGVAFAVGLGIYSFIKATSAPPLHPDPRRVPSVVESSPSPKWAGAVAQGRQLARAGVAEQNLPGLSVAVGVDGAIVWAEGFGWADVERRVPVAPHTRFRIGHASKPLTSAAVGLLLEQGRLHLDDDIREHVPAFPRKQWPVTLRQLMGHVAGVRHYDTERDYLPTEPCLRASEGLRFFADDPLRFEPETAYGYSTYGWILVSAAVEAAANEAFFTFMDAQVFRRLGMMDTTPDSASAPDRVTFYHPRFNDEPGAAPDVDYSCFAGAGGFLSTPSDLVRFGLAFNGGTLLPRATARSFQMPQVLVSGEETAYGLGWMLETIPLAGEPTREAGHASRTPVGGSTSFLTFPERGLAVAVTANISRKDTRSIALGIAAAFAEAASTPARK